MIIQLFPTYLYFFLDQIEEVNDDKYFGFLLYDSSYLLKLKANIHFIFLVFI